MNDDSSRQKIMHCCLSFDYVDGFGYQENILPEMHANMGYDVVVVTSTIIDRPGMARYQVDEAEYVSENGVRIIRLNPVGIPYFINRYLRAISCFSDVLNRESPDILFIHEVYSLSELCIIKYKKNNPKVEVFVDNHNDYYNSGKNWISLNLLHKGLYKILCQRIKPYVSVFWGTLPIRCEFLNKIYGVEKDKIGFLPMGINDLKIPFEEKKQIRISKREELGIDQDEFVLITGGKINAEKKLDVLIELIDKIYPSLNVMLLVFGLPSPDYKDEFETLIHHKRVNYVGWIDSEMIYQLFFLADLAVFIGGHSVLWEQSVACGLPGVFVKREGMMHIDIGGNCRFVEEPTFEQLSCCVSEIVNNKNKYEKMKNISEKYGKKFFSYSNIAVKAISSDSKKEW